MDLDACKTRLKKAKVAEAKAAVSAVVPPDPLPPPHDVASVVLTLTMSVCVFITFAVRWRSEYQTHSRDFQYDDMLACFSRALCPVFVTFSNW